MKTGARPDDALPALDALPLTVIVAATAEDSVGFPDGLFKGIIVRSRPNAGMKILTLTTCHSHIDHDRDDIVQCHRLRLRRFRLR